MIIIPIKWLFHWEYTLFSDKPIFFLQVIWHWMGKDIESSQVIHQSLLFPATVSAPGHAACRLMMRTVGPRFGDPEAVGGYCWKCGRGAANTLHMSLSMYLQYHMIYIYICALYVWSLLSFLLLLSLILLRLAAAAAAAAAVVVAAAAKYS